MPFRRVGERSLIESSPRNGCQHQWPIGPYDSGIEPSDAALSPPPAAAAPRGVCRFAQRWANAVGRATFVTMTSAEVEAFLDRLTCQLFEALSANPPRARHGRRVGAALATTRYADPSVLRRTLAVIAEHFLADVAADLPAHLDPARQHENLSVLLGTLAEGYTDALRSAIVSEQEQVREVAVRAVRSAERRRRTTEARFRAVFNDAGVGIAVVDTTGMVVDVNPAFAAMLGVPATRLRGVTLDGTVDVAGAPELFTGFAELVAGKHENVRTEFPHQRPDGRRVLIDLSMTLVREEDEPRYVIGVAVDVTERRRLEDRLRYEANHDPLTGLPNRKRFFDRLAELADAIGPDDRRIGLCLLDLDGFKAVNDSLGHEFGDRLLVAVAERLLAAAEPGRMVARLGGDEFVVLIEDSADAGDAVVQAESVLALMAYPFTLDDHVLSVTASVGVLERPLRGADPAELMRSADITLYRAKAAGKGRWALFDAERNAEEVTRHTLTTAIPAALQRSEFFLEYQPMVDLVDGSVRGVEALVRWRHPRFGVLSPDQFIALAESTGLIVPLGGWVLEEACRQAHRWARESARPPFVSVNLAVGQAEDTHVLDRVRSVLTRTKLPPHLLQLELTESAVLGGMEGPLDALRALAASGIRIAIDDFGTGYSNLAYLGRIPMHEIKLAGSFVSELHTGPGPRPTLDTVVAAMISLAHGLGLSVTAEAVETESQAGRLRELGCDRGQGWLYARPGSAERIRALLLDGVRPASVRAAPAQRSV